MTVRSVLHKLVDELNRGNLHGEIDETQTEFEERIKPVVSELDQLKADVAALKSPAVSEGTKAEPVSSEDSGNEGSE